MSGETAHTGLPVLDRVRSSYVSFTKLVEGETVQYGTVLNELLHSVQADVERRTYRRMRAEEEYSCSTDDSRPRLRAQHQAAVTAERDGLIAVRLLHEALEVYGAASRKYTNDAARNRDALVQRMEAFQDSVAAYTGGTSVSGGSGRVTAAWGTDHGLAGLQPQGGVESALAAALSARGMELFPVAGADFNDNPIISWNKAEPADFAWACEKWNAVVAPALAKGESLEDLEAKDRASGAQVGSLRELARVWDLFLGSDTIRIVERVDGSFEVDSGRHRMETFARLGITSAPVVVVRRAGRDA